MSKRSTPDRFFIDPEPLEHRTHLVPFDGTYPSIHPSVYLASGSYIVGDVQMGADCSVWYNAVVRGDVHHIRIGTGTNIQDNCVVHVTHDTNPTVIGDWVTVGHSAILHGCTVEDRCLIGMGARVLDRAIVRSGAFVAAGALVPPGFEVPSGMLVAGVPARVVRPLRSEEAEEVRVAADRYADYARRAMQSIKNRSRDTRLA